jgi:NADH-quinone oxidoreductase subunit I
MYCGICIEVCPFDALFWSPEFEYAETDIRDLTHERDKLREWMWTVPAPPALDPGAEEPKELAAARKTAEKLAAQQQPTPTGPTTPAEPAAPAEPTGSARPTGPGARPAPPTGTEPHADEQARAAEQPTRPMGESKQQTDQPRPDTQDTPDSPDTPDGQEGQA